MMTVDGNARVIEGEGRDNAERAEQQCVVDLLQCDHGLFSVGGENQLLNNRPRVCVL